MIVVKLPINLLKSLIPPPSHLSQVHLLTTLCSAVQEKPSPWRKGKGRAFAFFQGSNGGIIIVEARGSPATHPRALSSLLESSGDSFSSSTTSIGTASLLYGTRRPRYRRLSLIRSLDRSLSSSSHSPCPHFRTIAIVNYPYRSWSSPLSLSTGLSLLPLSLSAFATRPKRSPRVGPPSSTFSLVDAVAIVVVVLLVIIIPVITGVFPRYHLVIGWPSCCFRGRSNFEGLLSLSSGQQSVNRTAASRDIRPNLDKLSRVKAFQSFFFFFFSQLERCS